MRRAFKVLAVIAAAAVVAAAAAFLCLKILYPVKYRSEVNGNAERYGFPPELIFAVIRAESGFDPDAVSEAGAVGLMQLMPATAAFISAREGIQAALKDLRDPSVNISLGCAYLRYLAVRFKGDMRLALYAYNAGEGNVAAWLADPGLSSDGKTLDRIPYKETELYYERVKRAESVYLLLLNALGR